MNEQTVLDIAYRTIYTLVLIASPALFAALVTGLLVSIFQAATQIQEQTLSFIPKILAMFFALFFAGPWILQTITTFTIQLYGQIADMGQR